MNHLIILNAIEGSLSKLNCKYENIMLIGNFILTIANKFFVFFITSFQMGSLIKSPTCCQPKSPRCFAFILTNQEIFFKHSNVLEVGIYDHLGLIVIACKVRLPPSKKYFICFNETPFKRMKNAFYFILKALFVLKIS